MNDSTAPRVLDLDPAVLGQTLIRLPAIAQRMGHKNLRPSLRQYGAPLTPEAEYIYDLFRLNADQIREKWYGADSDALDRELAAATAALIRGHRS